jgi:hypothetical protein
VVAVSLAVVAVAATGAAIGAATDTSGSGDALTAAIVVSGLSVLSLIVGGFITHLTNKRTGSSPPAEDADDINLGRKVLLIESEYRDVRKDVDHNSDRLDSIDQRVGPLAEQVKVRFEEVYRRLIQLESERRRDRQ